MLRAPEKSKDKVFAILMASGFSLRFGGENKLLYPFRDKPLARHTLDLVCQMRDCFEKIFFVTSDEKVAAIAEGLPVTLIHNTKPENDIGESVRLGVQSAEKTCSAGYYFFFPCDQPLLDKATVRRILSARKPGCIVEPFAGDNSPGAPNLFSGVFKNELLALGNEKPRVIKIRHPDAVIKVKASTLALADIDTLDDIKKYG
jgi:CTP:molybdopterin cytidylyltransferase MocA